MSQRSGSPFISYDATVMNTPSGQVSDGVDLVRRGGASTGHSSIMRR